MLETYKKVKEILNSGSTVQVELSNLCNYAPIHKKCYANQSEKKEGKLIMPQKAIIDIVDTLVKYKWDSPEHEIKFHEYNEPLIDPRLTNIVEMVRKFLPSTSIMIWSNGYYLNDVIASELTESGVTKFRLTAYNDNEYQRFIGIKKRLKQQLINTEINSANNLPIYFRIDNRVQLDDRLLINNREDLNTPDPCHALKSINVRSDGRITLCCFDINKSVFLGDINQGGLEQTLIDHYEYRMRLKAELENGTKTPIICRKCNHIRPPAKNVSHAWQKSKIFG